mgnify:FL=1
MMPDIQIQKPITFRVPEDIVTRHTTHLVISPLPGRYILSFFETLPPIVVGETEQEKRATWEKITHIPATCVARLVVAEADIGGFIQVLQQQQQLMKQQVMQDFKAFA